MTARAWSGAERRVVLRGFFGRLTIAIEPLILGLFFLALPIALMIGGTEIAHLVAPIFAFGALAFIIYAIFLIAPAIRAVFETLLPIYTVNGFLRYRQHRAYASAEPENYVAVLDADRKVLGEWRMRDLPGWVGERALWPAVVEYSRYGGIHTIDGQPTGVLPKETSPLGVGIAHDAERRAVQL